MASSRNCRLEIPSFRVARSISLRVASSRRVEKIFCIRKHHNVSEDVLDDFPYFVISPQLSLQPAHLLEAAVPRVAEHDVVHEINAHHRAGLHQPPRQLMIVGARGRIP